MAKKPGVAAFARDSLDEVKDMLERGEARLARGVKGGWADILNALEQSSQVWALVDEAGAAARRAKKTREEAELERLATEAMGYRQLAWHRAYASLTAGFFARLTGS